MEFREFSNPEERYDINSSLGGNSSSSSQNIQEENLCFMQLQLFDLIGILEDFDEDELIENYGITMQEYLKPTAETIKKISEKLNTKQNKRSK